MSVSYLLYCAALHVIRHVIPGIGIGCFHVLGRELTYVLYDTLVAPVAYQVILEPRIYAGRPGGVSGYLRAWYTIRSVS